MQPRNGVGSLLLRGKLKSCQYGEDNETGYGSTSFQQDTVSPLL